MGPAREHVHGAWMDPNSLDAHDQRACISGEHYEENGTCNRFQGTTFGRVCADHTPRREQRAVSVAASKRFSTAWIRLN
jgi:hypothetical protein